MGCLPVFLNTWAFHCDNLLLHQDFCIHLGKFSIFHYLCFKMKFVPLYF